MPPFALCGPQDTAQSSVADAQVTINFYTEFNASTKKWALYGTPGRKVFVSSNGMRALRDELEISGRAFAVWENLASQYLIEVFANRTFLTVGTLGPAGGNVTMAVNNASPAQLMITSAGRLFLATLASPNTILTEISTNGTTALQGLVADVRFLGPYFLARLKGTQRFQISSPLDGSLWDPADIAQVQLFPDVLKASIVDHLTYWLFSGTKGVAYSDTGNPDFPIEPYTASVVEQGVAGELALCQQDNTVFLLTQDQSGARFLGRLNGFKLDRVSDHNFENEIRRYPVVSDVEFYPYSESGHPFVMMFFPTAPNGSTTGAKGVTWGYDVATGEMHKRQALDGGADRARCHMNAFGKHLLGDPFSGTIYESSIDLVDDAGALIRRIRRAPLPHNENQWLDIGTLEVLAEMGLGPTPPLLDGAGLPRGPQMGLRISRDYAKTWGTQLFRDAGKVGEFFQRLRWTRNGRARGGWVEIEVTDPIPWRITDGFYQAA